MIVQVSSDSFDTNQKDNFKNYTKVFSSSGSSSLALFSFSSSSSPTPHLQRNDYLQELRTEADLEMIGNKKAKEVNDPIRFNYIF